jgi:uncharacterized protein YkwD
MVLLVALGGFLAPGLQQECRSETASTLTHVTTMAVPDGRLEHDLLMLTNQERGHGGLQALAVDDALMQVAREHAAGMARQGFISHELPDGNLQTRLISIGYRYAAARENVATAGSVAYAQNALMHSPAHKDNILAADVDRIGIGIVHGPPPFESRLYITEIFATPDRDHQPVEVEEILMNRVEDLRKNGAGSMLPDPMLSRLASDSVMSLNVPVQRAELQTLLANSAEELHKRGRSEIARVDISVQLVHNPKKFSLSAPAHIGQQASMFGSAIRQVVDNRNEPVFLVLTLIGFTN